MNNRSSDSVGDILPRVLKRLGLGKRMEEAKLLREWSAVVGEVVSRRSKPCGIRRGLLFIEVENNVWMQEIRFHQREIIAKIESMFPGLDIKGIRLELKREREEE